MPRSLPICTLLVLLGCASSAVEGEAVAEDTSTGAVDVVTTMPPAPDDETSSSGTSLEEVESLGSCADGYESESDGGTSAGEVPPTDGWFAATTRVIFYANHYGAISAHGLAITDQLSTAPGLVDYSFDFDLQSGRAQSISLWESELDFWMFVMGAAHAKAMVELNDPVAGRDFSYATWWVENETLPTRIEADAHLGPEPMPGPFPVD